MNIKKNYWIGKHGPMMIAEIGANHEGNFSSAKKLVKLAGDSTKIISSSHYDQPPGSPDEIIEEIDEISDSGNIIKIVFNTSGKKDALKLLLDPKSIFFEKLKA